MIGKWFKKTGRRNDIFLATKFANTLDGKFNVRGDPEYVKQACADSLKRLDIPQIDLYYLHRLSHLGVI
jgi:aryl-alcohol dehydrogenase-like predicted oxidoreductase